MLCQTCTLKSFLKLHKTTKKSISSHSENFFTQIALEGDLKGTRRTPTALEVHSKDTYRALEHSKRT